MHSPISRSTQTKRPVHGQKVPSHNPAVINIDFAAPKKINCKSSWKQLSFEGRANIKPHWIFSTLVSFPLYLNMNLSPNSATMTSSHGIELSINYARFLQGFYAFLLLLFFQYKMRFVNCYHPSKTGTTPIENNRYNRARDEPKRGQACSEGVVNYQTKSLTRNNHESMLNETKGAYHAALE